MWIFLQDPLMRRIEGSQILPAGAVIHHRFHYGLSFSTDPIQVVLPFNAPCCLLIFNWPTTKNPTLKCSVLTFDFQVIHPINGTGRQQGREMPSPRGSTTSSSKPRRSTSFLGGSSPSPSWCSTSGTGATTCRKLKAKQRKGRRAKLD